MQLIVSSLETKEYQVACDKIDSLISDSLPADQLPQTLLDLKRFAARMAFIAANDYHAPFEYLRNRFEARCELGFGKPEDALAILTEYAFKCIDLHETDAAKRALCEAKSYVSAVHLTKGLNQYIHIIQACEQLIDSH